MSYYLRQFEIVIEIANRGSISKAADALKLTQPTLSKYVQKIEKSLGVELFDRTTIPIRLTEAGEKYIHAGKRMLDTNYQMEKELDELRMNKESAIKIGISPSRAPYILPDIVEEYRKNNESVKIVIKERTTNQLNAELLRGELDVIINLSSESTKLFEKESLFKESIYIAVPSSMKDMNAMDILQNAAFINIGSGQRMWKLLNIILNDVGGMHPKIECQSIESALSFVKKGLGAMLVPSYIEEHYRNEQQSAVAFKELPAQCYQGNETAFVREVCLFYRKEQFLSQEEKKFIETCKRVIKKTFKGENEL